MFAKLLRHHGLPPLWGRRPGFATLVRIILEQQVPLAAARTMYRRLDQELGGVAGPFGDGGRRPAALGLTRQKARIRTASPIAVLDGRLDLGAVARAPDDDGRRAAPGSARPRALER